MSLTQTVEETDTLRATVRLHHGGARTNEISVDLRDETATSQSGPAGNDFTDSGVPSVKVSTYPKDQGQEEEFGGCGPRVVPRVGGVGGESNKMQVFVQNCMTTGKTLTFTLSTKAFVSDLRKKISDHTGVTDYRLNYAGRELENGRTLSYYDIRNESTIQMLGRLRGG